MINIENIADKLGFDLDDVQMLMDMFLDNANESLVELENSINSKNFQGIKDASHAIKGSSANLLLDEISTLAAKIENFAKSSKDVDYIELKNQLSNKIKDVEELKEIAC